MAWGKPYQKGQSGNPKGRPKKGKALSEILRSYLAEADEADGGIRNERLAQRLWELTRSVEPDVALAAVKYIFDRIDGKVPDPINVKTSGKLIVEVVRVAGRAKSQD